jgi:hypothetical protein
MHRRPLALIAVCIAVLGLAACGGDDETASTSSTTTPTGATGADTTGGVDTSDLPDPSTLREQFNQQLLQILTSTQGMSQSQAECAVKELETRISDEEIQQAIAEAAQTGQSPQDLIDEAYDAGAKCADQ